MMRITPLQQKKTSLLLFVLSLSFPFFVGAQQNFLEEYEMLQKLDINPSLKISKTESWINTITTLSDSTTLGKIYNDFSKQCYKQREYHKAIFNAKQALKFQPISDKNNTYSNLSVFYNKVGQEKQAFLSLKKLVASPYKDKFTITAYVNGLANTAITKGDYYQALECIQEAERIIRVKKDSTLNKESYRIPMAYSGVFIKLGGEENNLKAIKHLEKAKQLNEKIDKNKVQIKNKIIIHNRFGQAFTQLKKYSKAISHFEKALKTCIDHKKSKKQIAIILNNLGLNHFKNGQLTKSLEYYNEVFKYNPYYTATYDNLGDYYLHLKEYQLALTNYQKAIDYNLGITKNNNYQDLPTKELLEKSENKTYLLNDLKDKSKAWLSYFEDSAEPSHLKYALNTIELADYMVDLIRSESTETQSQFFWRAEGIDLYMLATSICYRLNQPEKAFYFMEKSKSLSLLENLTHEEAKKLAKLPDSIINREYELKKNIFLTRQKPDNNDLEVTEQRHLVFQQKKIYNDFIRSLEKDFPNYYQYKKEIPITTLKQCQNKNSSTKTSIIQYILSNQEGYGLFISPQKTVFFKIESIQLLQKEILTIGTFINQPWKTKDHKIQFQKLSHSIYRRLFPFEISELKNTSSNLIIIPDGILQYFPFEVLQDPSNTSLESSYLITQFNISYLYSNSLHYQILRKKTTASKQMMAIAPVNFEHLKLPNLLLSTSKLEKLGKKIKMNTLVYSQATKKNFIKNSTDYKIFHLSSHASSMDDTTPWIAFDDGKLTLNELYFIPNQADMVILDACKTGIGELIPGEGTQSLTRGFFHSGAKSVVSSLWNTNEKSNTEIITNFYNYLKKGIPKSKALRKAKLDFLSNHYGSEKSPYYWGALILTGDNSPIPILENESNYWMILIISIAVLLVILFFIKKYRPTIINNSRAIS